MKSQINYKVYKSSADIFIPIIAIAVASGYLWV